MNRNAQDRAQTAAFELAHPKPMRRGSLSERYVRCNKAGCACREDPEARHGPYLSVTRGVSGKTRSFWVSAEWAEVVRRQVDSGKEFRKKIEEYWEACEAWADEELETGSASPEAAEKGGSGRPWKRKSARKSRP